jgi:acetyl esterase/lipase
MLRPWMAEVFDGSYAPDPGVRGDRLISPAGAGDTADLTGIAPALVITAELDLLRAEGDRYAERLRRAGALVEHHVVIGADHAYDAEDDGRAREVYALVARHVRDVPRPG